MRSFSVGILAFALVRAASGLPWSAGSDVRLATRGQLALGEQPMCLHRASLDRDIG